MTLVDEHLKGEDDLPTLGLLLCKQQHRVVAEYALRGMTQPIGIAEYKLQLPEDLARYLPSIEQIEAELQEDVPLSTPVTPVPQPRRPKKRS